MDKLAGDELEWRSQSGESMRDRAQWAVEGRGAAVCRWRDFDLWGVIGTMARYMSRLLRCHTEGNKGTHTGR